MLKKCFIFLIWMLGLPLTAAHATAPHFSLSAQKMPIQALLLGLAQRGGLNMDIHPEIKGEVTFFAKNQTLPIILDRLAQQAHLRWRVHQNRFIIEPDTPFIKPYSVEYVNLARHTDSKISISTTLAATGGSVSSNTTPANTPPSALVGNTSSTSVVNTADHHFWPRLEKLLRDTLNEPATSSAISVHPETGTVQVRATLRQHRQIEKLLTQLQNSARRQVLIEATLIEVNLNEDFQTGVDWTRLLQEGEVSVQGSFLNNTLGQAPFFALGLNRNHGRLTGILKMIEQVGKTRVLSSPRVVALNNQTAVLKVVEEKVYFTTRIDVQKSTTNQPEERVYTSQINTVPVGVVMSVTPQVDNQEGVLLNIRPTVSRITGYKTDPVPSLLGLTVQNQIPEIQVRELESTLKLSSGQVAILGGLIQEDSQESRQGVPVLGRIPLLGRLFSAQSAAKGKNELIILLRPTVVTQPPNQLSPAALGSGTEPS